MTLGISWPLDSISASSKKNLNFKQITLQLAGQAAKFEFESKFKPLQVIWQSLSKAFREDRRRFWVQNQWPSSWGSAQAQLGRVRQASSTNTGLFQVGSSRCRQLLAECDPACLRKTCYLSWDTNWVPVFQNLKRVLMLYNFFCCNKSLIWNLIWIGKKLLPTKAGWSIFLSLIGLWVKIWHGNKSEKSELNPVSALTHALLFCCMLYDFVIFGFCSWWSCTDRV